MILRYGLLFLLAPALALAQTPDSVSVIVEGSTYGAWAASFGPPFPPSEDIGPLPLVAVESAPSGDFPDASANEGCNPLTAESAAELEGSIAFIERGSCTFVTKVRNASAAGAAAVIVYNDERDGEFDNTLVLMSGKCEEADGCTAPAAFISRQSSLEILPLLEDGTEATIRNFVDPPPPTPPTSALLDTEAVQTEIYEDGFIGQDPAIVCRGFCGLGFRFNGVQGLFIGAPLVGIGGEVTGNPYSGISDYAPLQDAETLTGPFDAPFQNVEQAGRVRFSSPLGFEITLTAYADQDAPNTDFVVFDLAAVNTSGANRDAVYFGLFADWDAGTTSADDAAGFAASLGLAYVYDPAEDAPYFGVMTLSEDDVSGYGLDVTTADDAQLFDALTTANPAASEPAERAAVVGLGPFDLAAGEARTVRFALVAGEDEADLLLNASIASAGCGVCPSVERVTPASRFVLETPYPNPVSARATLGFTLPRSQAVRLAVYDVLGREAAVLADGVRPAGEQAVAFDTAGLPSGAYLVRLDAGAARLTQRLTVLR